MQDGHDHPGRDGHPPELPDGDALPHLDEIAQIYGDLVRAELRRLGFQNGPDLDDACQDVWMKLLRSLQSFVYRGESALRAWIKKGAYTTGLSILCNRNRRRRVLTDSPSDASLDARSIEDYRERMEDDESSERRIQLRAALDRLPPEQRIVMEYDLAGLGSQAIAKALQISASAVHSRRTRAMKALRSALDKRSSGREDRDRREGETDQSMEK